MFYAGDEVLAMPRGDQSKKLEYRFDLSSRGKKIFHYDTNAYANHTL
jgi:hypothetical protein